MSTPALMTSKEYDILWCRNCGATYAIEHEWFTNGTNGRGPGYGFDETLTPLIPHCCIAVSLRAGGPPYTPDTGSYVKIIKIIVPMDPSHKIVEIHEIRGDRIELILEGVK